jgi:hypothetical protein
MVGRIAITICGRLAVKPFNLRHFCMIGVSLPAIGDSSARHREGQYNLSLSLCFVAGLFSRFGYMTSIRVFQGLFKPQITRLSIISSGEQAN